MITPLIRTGMILCAILGFGEYGNISIQGFETTVLHAAFECLL